MGDIRPQPDCADPEPDRECVTRDPRCIICGSRRFTPMQGIGRSAFDLLVCDRCGTGQVHPLPDRAQLDDLYSSDYYGGENEGKFRPFVEVLVRLAGAVRARRLVRGLGPGSRILDLGCGRGTMLGAFADLGMEVHGVEVNERAAKGADPRAEIHFSRSLSDVGFPSQHFDRVVIWHVLEHLLNPRETLVEVRRILKPGGRVAIAVPNFSSVQARWTGASWFHLDLPRHLHHFPLKGLQTLVESCGLRCLEVRHFSLRQNPFGWIQSALNLSGQFPRDHLYRMLQGSADAAGTSRLRRSLEIAAFGVGIPVSMILSLTMALLHRGATVSVHAEKPPMAD